MATPNERNSSNLENGVHVKDERKDATPSERIDGSDHGFGQRFFMGYGAWVVLIQLKFQNVKKSPFETEGFFLKTSAAALCLYILCYEILLYAKKNNLNCPKMVKIVTGVCWFLGILSHLSLLLVIFTSPNMKKSRYLIISGLFVAILGYTFRHDILRFGNKMCDDIREHIKELKELNTSSSSTTTIPVCCV